MIAASAPEAILPWIEREFGHVFARPDLAVTALTHRSAAAAHNERLEFLGDAVVNCVVAQMLFEAHPRADEGSLSRQRATLVSGRSLARIAAERGVGERVRFGAGEAKSGGHRRESILADALESIVGAVFVDAGFDAAAAVVRRLLAEPLAQLPEVAALKDPKTRLQEALQGRGVAVPEYHLIAVRGEPHLQHFEVRCEVPALGLTASGEGVSRRRAEQLAAERLIERLHAPGRRPS